MWEILSAVVAIPFVLAVLILLIVWLWHFQFHVRDAVRNGWYKARCASGNHGERFYADRERTLWFDFLTNQYVTEITRFKRCSRCFRRIEGSEITEAKEGKAKHDLEDAIPLKLKPGSPLIQEVEKGAGAPLV